MMRIAINKTMDLLRQRQRSPQMQTDEAAEAAMLKWQAPDEHSPAEMFERQEFAFESAVRMRDRFLQQETWERLGVDVKEAVKADRKSVV